jgi:mannose-1-phosphate guanylyltransferase
MFVPAILAGGLGTRLWPLSRQLYPKQCHALTSERTMLTETIARLWGKIPLELIEVQSGSYLGEDDIARFEDRYGRP